MTVIARTLVLVALLIVTAGLVPAQQTEPPAAPATVAAPPQDAPKLVFESLVHDFGKLNPDQIVNYEFKFKNDGKGILEIQNVKTSCGCTAALPDKKLIGPGESSSIKVQYHAGRGSGIVEKTISVMSTDPDMPTTTLRISGMIVSEMDLNPAFVRMTDIDNSKPSEMEVLVTPRYPEKFELTNVQCDIPAIGVTVNKMPDGHIKLVVTYNPDKLPQPAPGFLNGLVRGITNVESQPELKLPVYIKFKEDYTAIPARVMIFGSSDPGSGSREVIIRSNKETPFQITGVVSSNPFIKVEITTNGQAANVIKISADKSAPTPIISAAVTVNIDKKFVNIPVRARMGTRPDSEPPTAVPVQPAVKEE